MLPKLTSRHAVNQSYFLKSSDTILWTIQWVFLKKQVKLNSSEIDDTCEVYTHENCENYDLGTCLDNAIAEFQKEALFIHMNKNYSGNYSVLRLVEKRKIGIKVIDCYH
jgi:hypothetical protein